MDRRQIIAWILIVLFFGVPLLALVGSSIGRAEAEDISDEAQEWDHVGPTAPHSEPSLSQTRVPDQGGGLSPPWSRGV